MTVQQFNTDAISIFYPFLEKKHAVTAKQCVKLMKIQISGKNAHETKVCMHGDNLNWQSIAKNQKLKLQIQLYTNQ